MSAELASQCSETPGQMVHAPGVAARPTTAGLGTVAAVSVIVPAYGHADYIVASLASALAQGSPPCEIIVVDDGSPDDTPQRVAPLVQSGQIRYVRQENAGMAAARNAGAQLATGDYLYFLDDDDLLFPGALGWMVDELERHPEVAMVLGESTNFEGVPPERPDHWSEPWDVDPVAFMFFNQLGSPGQVLIRRSAFIAVGGFDPTIWGTDDWDLWLRLLARYPARAARRPVLAYRVHTRNASRNIARMYDSSLCVARRGLNRYATEQRVKLRRYTYRRLRQYHAPRLTRMVAAEVRRGAWGTAAAAARSWARSWVLDGVSLAAMKMYLLRHGQWRLAADDPLIAAIHHHGG